MPEVGSCSLLYSASGAMWDVIWHRKVLAAAELCPLHHLSLTPPPPHSPHWIQKGQLANAWIHPSLRRARNYKRLPFLLLKLPLRRVSGSLYSIRTSLQPVDPVSWRASKQFRMQFLIKDRPRTFRTCWFARGSSLYRRCLKLSLDWAVHRYIWRGQALYIRSLFEANKDIREPRQQRVRAHLPY